MTMTVSVRYNDDERVKYKEVFNVFFYGDNMNEVELDFVDVDKEPLTIKMKDVKYISVWGYKL